VTIPRIGVRVMLTTSRVSWRVSCTLGRVSSITNTRDLLRNKLGPRAGGLVVAKNGHSIIAFQRCPALEKIRARYCHCYTALVGLCHVCAFPFPGRDSLTRKCHLRWQNPCLLKIIISSFEYDLSSLLGGGIDNCCSCSSIHNIQSIFTKA
jgi:hypothetical protein